MSRVSVLGVVSLVFLADSAISWAEQNLEKRIILSPDKMIQAGRLNVQAAEVIRGMQKEAQAHGARLVVHYPEGAAEEAIHDLFDTGVNIYKDPDIDRNSPFYIIAIRKLGH